MQSNLSRAYAANQDPSLFGRATLMGNYPKAVEKRFGIRHFDGPKLTSVEPEPAETARLPVQLSACCMWRPVEELQLDTGTHTCCGREPCVRPVEGEIEIAAGQTK